MLKIYGPFIGVQFVFASILQEPLTEQEIEELVAEFMEVESKVSVITNYFCLSC